MDKHPDFGVVVVNDNQNDEKPSFDLEQAKSMLNKHVLIGLTYYDHEGKFIEQKQIHGKIISVSQKGFSIKLEGLRSGETYNLPLDLRSFQKARPGTYKLRSTGEEIVDPDYLASWNVYKPPSN